MKPSHAILAVALVALPVAAGGDQIPSPSADAVPALAQGMILNLDPAAKPVQPAQATDLRAILGDAVSMSAAGLVEEKSPVPGGGVMVDLQGRFQNAMTAQIDEDGNVTVPCASGDVAKEVK